MMNIKKIMIGGITNIDKVSLDLSKICALLALNNYGKSNVLDAISFGLDFLKSNTYERNIDFYRDVNSFIPINKHVSGKDFSFGIDLTLEVTNIQYDVSYSYSFKWPSNHCNSIEIQSELLKIKSTEDLKFKKYINRSLSSCQYLSSPNGRCSNKIETDSSQLAISKLSNYDELFYVDIIKKFLALNVVITDSLADPKTFFRTLYVQGEHSALCGISKFPDLASCAGFMYELKKSDSYRYDLFTDAIRHLIPSIETFEPVKIDFKRGKVEDVPYVLPEVLYDIRVKEKNLNQEITIDKLSSGTKRIFYLLLMTVAAAKYKVPLLVIEELENSIHPSLFQNLLITITNLAEDTQILITSHSPYLLQYLNPAQLYIGVPNSRDIASFKKIKPSKINALLKDAADYELSLGDYLFDLLTMSVDDNDSLKYFE